MINITIIYDDSTKNNKHLYTDFLLSNLKNQYDLNLMKYYLPDNLNSPNDHFYNYYYMINQDAFFYNFQFKELKNSIANSDIIIFSCSDLNRHILPKKLKILLNSLSYFWMPHKNTVFMKNKIGIIISNDSIPLIISASKSIKNHLKFWGIKYIFNVTSKNQKCGQFSSENYLSSMFLATKICNIISSNNLFSHLNSEKVIRFPLKILKQNIIPIKHKTDSPKEPVKLETFSQKKCRKSF